MTKTDSKDIYNVTKDLYVKIAVHMNFLFIKQSWKMYHGFHKNVKHQISILEWFLKDHVTRRLCWKFSFSITGKQFF